MVTELSENAKAILLLTAPLSSGKRADAVEPLGFTAYGALALWLRDHGLEPADLLAPGGNDELAESEFPFDGERIRQLLGRGFQLSQAVERWQSRAIWVISRADDQYPKEFKKRLGRNAPPVLYGCGEASLLESGGLAVVGSRDIGDDATEYTEGIGRLAAEAGCAIVSGGARGVDQAAMRGCLEKGGMVLGVLADRLENAALDRGNRDHLMDERLVLVSPYDPRAGFNVGNAMQRNKMIYAFANAALVVESTYGKGGTWSGATEQLDRLHLVPVYVRGDDGLNQARRALMSKGAGAWPNPQSPDDFRLVLEGGTLASEIPTSDAGSTDPSALVIDGPGAERDADTLVAVPADDTVTGIEVQGKRTESTGQKPLLFQIEEVSGVDDDNICTESVEAGRNIEHNYTGEEVASDALFAEVERLLARLDSPISDSDVPRYLGVAQGQAREWLKRLVQEGKYRKLSMPRVHYQRII